MEKVSITPRISKELSEELRKACHERGRTQGDLVEIALEKYLHPGPDDLKLELLYGQQQDLCKAVEMLAATMEAMSTSLDAVFQQREAVQTLPAPAIATYDMLYGAAQDQPATAAPPEQPTSKKPGLFRWLYRTESAA